MDVREYLMDNIAGDLEYHLRRAVLYLVLATAAVCFWYFSPPETQFAPLPLVVGLGSLSLVLKGVFLLRKSSEGLGLSEQDRAALSEVARRKVSPPLPSQVAQILQDFGTGPMLLWPLIDSFRNTAHDAAGKTHVLPVFFVGAILFGAGWLIRRLTAAPTP
jgi:hypothetical protein